MVDPRAIEEVYRRAHAVMCVQLELQMTSQETPVTPELEELVRALRSQGEVVE
jgi:hypothetical protein